LIKSFKRKKLTVQGWNNILLQLLQWQIVNDRICFHLHSPQLEVSEHLSFIWIFRANLGLKNVRRKDLETHFGTPSSY
jgi:hypothetical protein